MLNDKIISFLKSSTVLSLSVCKDNIPYSASCFYKFLEKENIILFKSAPETLHIQIAIHNPAISCTILPDKLNFTALQGIQMRGIFIRPDNEHLLLYKKEYYLKYPFAVSIQGQIWGIEPEEIKMTDNSLGFGKKIIWSKNTELQYDTK